MLVAPRRPNRAYNGTYTAAMARRRIMSAQQVRQNFSGRIDAAERDGEHTVVLRRSAPAVMLVPAVWYSRACEAMGEPWEDWTPPDEPDDPEES